MCRLRESNNTKTAFMGNVLQRLESANGKKPVLFDRSLREALHDEALPNQKQNEGRQNGERRARCHLSVLNLEILGEFGDSHRHSCGLLGRKIQSDCKLVPAEHECQDTRCSEAWRDDRKDDIPQKYRS